MFYIIYFYFYWFLFTNPGTKDCVNLFWLRVNEFDENDKGTGSFGLYLRINLYLDLDLDYFTCILIWGCYFDLKLLLDFDEIRVFYEIYTYAKSLSI